MAHDGGRYSYTFRRIVLYALLWCTSVVVLGLTAWRRHKTKDIQMSHRSVVSELLATSVLTAVWVPIAITLLVIYRVAGAVTGANHRGGVGARHPRWIPEMVGTTLMWILWLVGSAFLTNYFPTSLSRGGGMQGKILTAILAFSWASFGLATLILILGLMHHASTRGARHYGGDTPIMSTTGRTGGRTVV